LLARHAVLFLQVVDHVALMVVQAAGEQVQQAFSDSGLEWRAEECRWLKPVLVGQFEYLEWTSQSPGTGRSDP
jgi:hypothetical protein